MLAMNATRGFRTGSPPLNGIMDPTDRFRSCCWVLCDNSEGERRGLGWALSLSPTLSCSSADDNIDSIRDSSSRMRLLNWLCLFPGWLAASMQGLPDF